jgi:hypothetical protein
VIGIDEGEVDLFLTGLREHLALLVLKDNGKLIGWMKVVRAYPQRWRKKCPLPV